MAGVLQDVGSGGGSVHGQMDRRVSKSGEVIWSLRGRRLNDVFAQLKRLVVISVYFGFQIGIR